MKHKLSVVVSSFNGESRLGKCLESAKHIADEIIVVNNSSTDKTRDIALAFTKKVYDRPNNLMLNTNKNFGFSKATSEWILNLDDDEQITLELAAEIKNRASKTNTEVNGYLIPRKNIIFGKWIQNSIWWPDYQLRLFKNGKGKFEEKYIHELIAVDGHVEKLTSPLIHENYNSISQWIYKMDKINTEHEAIQKLENSEKLEPLDAISLPARDFFKTFFMQKGYRDGLHGLVLSFLQAFYTEVVFAKMWERQGFKEEKSRYLLDSVYKEFEALANEAKYWYLSAKIDESRNPIKKTLLKLERKKALIKFKRAQQHD